MIPSSTCKTSGFTLLEVLIALVVLATALLALSGTINQSTRTQGYQKERTFAHYVGQYRLGELKLEPEWPGEGTTRGDVRMFNRDWQWKQVVSKTTDPGLRRIEVSVSTRDDENYALSKMIAFIGKPDDEESR